MNNVYVWACVNVWVDAWEVNIDDDEGAKIILEIKFLNLIIIKK